MATKLDYYEVLGVDRNATTEQIAIAYRKLAIKYHPDKNPGDEEAIASFKEAAEAFEVLNDEQKRSVYDRYGHAGLESRMGGGPQFESADDIFAAFGDLFGDLFGGRRSRRPRKGRDVRCDVTLTLHESANGVTKTVRYQRHCKCETCGGNGASPGSKKSSCDYCGGHGVVIQQAGIVRMQTTCPACRGQGSVIKQPCRACRGTGQGVQQVEDEVHIPAGVEDGMQVAIPGKGEPSPSGGPPGDCYCFVSVLQHPLFEREGQHLICRVPITYPQAALGCKLEVPTLKGRDEVEIPAGTQPGDVFRLGGRGMPDPRRRGLGDLIVQVSIEVPKKMSAEEENLLRQLAEMDNASVTPHRKSFFEKVKKYFTATDQDEN